MRGLDRIDASERVTVESADTDHHAAARQWLLRLAPRPVTCTDAVSLAVMERAGCRHVPGFDGDFTAAGFVLWSRVR